MYGLSVCHAGFAWRMWNSSELMRTFKQHSTMSFNGRRDRLSQRPTELLLALCLRLLPCQSPIKIQKSKNDSSNVRKGRSRGGVMRQPWSFRELGILRPSWGYFETLSGFSLGL